MGWVFVRCACVAVLFGLTAPDQPRSAICTAVACIALGAHDNVRKGGA